MKSKKLSSVPLDNPSVISIANSYGGLSPSLPCYSSVPVLTSTVKANTIVSGAITLPKLPVADGAYSLGIVNNVSSLVPAGGGGNPYALINSEIIADVIPDSLCVFTGANKTDCVSDETITIDRNTHQTTINYDLVCEDNVSIKNGNVLALYSDDNSNVCSIQCTIDGNLNLVSVQDKKVNVNNDLEVGGTVTVYGDVNVGGTLNIGLPDDYKYSLPIVAPDQDGQYIAFNTDGSSSFQTLPPAPSGLAYNPAQADQNMNGYNITNTPFINVQGGADYLTLDVNPGGGSRKISANQTLYFEAGNSLNFKTPGDVWFQAQGTGGIASYDFTNTYKFPNANLPSGIPLQDQVIQFNSNGTSQFATIAAGGNFSTPSDQGLDMNTHTITGVADLSLVSPTDPARTASLIVRDNGKTTLSSNQSIDITTTGTIEQSCNTLRTRFSAGGTFQIFTGDGNYYVLPEYAPTVDNSYISFGSNGFSSFQPMPVIPAPVVISQNKFNFYVSASGNDANNGSISSPYQTISACMTFVNTLSVDQQVSINLASGTYNEAVLVTKSGVSILGNSALGCIINGDLGVHMSQNSSFYSIFEASGIQIVGQVTIWNSTVYTNSSILNNCIVAPPQNFNCLTVDTTGGGLLADVTVRNCVLYTNTTSEGVVMTNGSIFMTATQIQGNPLFNVNTTKSMIKAIGASRVNLFGCSLLQNSSQATVGALIDIGNTSNATSSSTINNSIFIFGAATSTLTGAIMNFSNTASANTYNFYNNYCKCNVSVNSPNNYIVLKSSTGAVNFTQGNNLGTSSNHTVPATGFVTGWVKTTMNACV